MKDRQAWYTLTGQGAYEVRCFEERLLRHQINGLREMLKQTMDIWSCAATPEEVDFWSSEETQIRTEIRIAEANRRAIIKRIADDAQDELRAERDVLPHRVILESQDNESVVVDLMKVSGGRL